MPAAASTSPPERSWTSTIALVVMLIAGLIWWGLPRWRAYIETLGAWYVKAAPMVARAAGAAGEEILLATIVAQERPNWQRPTRRGYADDYVVELQLNRPDASDAGRILVYRTPSSVLNVAPLGTDADRVWLFGEGLRAVSVSRREVVVDPARLEARFPELRDQLSIDGRHYEWRPEGGIGLLTRDGRRFDLDLAAQTLTPAPEKTPVGQAKTHDEWLLQMAEYNRQVDVVTGPRYATTPGEYGLDSWRAGERWIGLLTDEAQRQYARAWARPSQASFSRPERRRIWLADVAPRPVEHPLEHSAVELSRMRRAGDKEYLGGGVLRDGTVRRAVAIPNAPDVLIEHYTAIDASAQVQLTRVTPDGTERWTATLPLGFPRTVAAAGDYVALTGFAPGVSDDRRMQLVSVRLADGAISTYAYNP